MEMRIAMQRQQSRKLSSFYIIIILECIILCLLLPGCFRAKQTVINLGAEQLEKLDTEADEGIEYVSPKMELAPGVYQVCVYTDMKQQEQSIIAEVICDSGFFHALRENEVKIFPNQSYVDFEVYVTDKISDAYIKFSMDCSDISNLKSAEVYKTNMGSRMLVFILTVFFFIMDLLVWWRRRLLDGKSDLQQLVVVCILTAVIFCAYFPYLTDYFYSGADTFFHILRIEGLKESLINGCPLPVRIQDYWIFGHGYAISMFYGDMFFLLPAFLRILGFSLMVAYKIFIFAIIVATVAVSYFSFYRITKDKYAALFGTIGYVLIPYHIFNFYTRGAIGECLAMIFIPLIGCGMYLLYTENVNDAKYKKYKWYLIFGFSALLQSHLISTELSICFIILTCIILLKKTFRKQTFFQLLETAGIALLLNCFFCLPLLYMLKEENLFLKETINYNIQNRGTSLAEMLQILPNRGNTLPSVDVEWKGLYNVAPVQIGIGILIAFVLHLRFLLVKGRSQINLKLKEEGLFAGYLGLTVIMSMRWFPWDTLQNIPVLGSFVSSLQFPTRWLILATFFSAAFEVFVYVRWKEEGGKWFKINTLLVAVLTIASGIYYVNDISYYSEPVYLYTAENMGTMSFMNGEYLLNSENRLFYSHDPNAEDGLIWNDYKKKGTEITIFLSNETDKECWLELPLIGYKGYTVENKLDGEKLSWITEKRGEHGDLRMLVPAGYAGYVRVWYEGLPVFHVAEMISLITVLGIFLFYLFCLWKRKKGVGENE